MYGQCLSGGQPVEDQDPRLARHHANTNILAVLLKYNTHTCISHVFMWISHHTTTGPLPFLLVLVRIPCPCSLFLAPLLLVMSLMSLMSPMSLLSFLASAAYLTVYGILWHVMGCHALPWVASGLPLGLRSLTPSRHTFVCHYSTLDSTLQLGRSYCGVGGVLIRVICGFRLSPLPPPLILSRLFKLPLPRRAHYPLSC